MNIIIKTPNFIGDTIMMMSALELVKMEYPNAKITIVCKEYSKDLFRSKNINKIIIDNCKGKNRFRKTLNLVAEIKKENYDLGILFHNTFLDALIFKLSNINKIIGYDKENRKILLDFHLKIDRTRHYVNHYANLVNKYFDNKYELLPEIKLDFKNTNLLKKEKKYLIAFVLGGDNKDTRKYPKKLSFELMSLIDSDKIDVVLLGDKDDCLNNSLYENELNKLNKNCINLSGKTSISEFIDVIAKVDLLVTIDSSAMHIAAAVGSEFIVLVGKGSSALDTVYPKVEFGHKIFEAKNFIKDEDLIYQIKAKTINDKINMIINKKANN